MIRVRLPPAVRVAECAQKIVWSRPWVVIGPRSGTLKRCSGAGRSRRASSGSPIIRSSAPSGVFGAWWLASGCRRPATPRLLSGGTCFARSTSWCSRSRRPRRRAAAWQPAGNRAVTRPARRVRGMPRAGSRAGLQLMGLRRQLMGLQRHFMHLRRQLMTGAIQVESMAHGSGWPASGPEGYFVTR